MHLRFLFSKQPEQVCMHLRRLFIYADSPLVRVMKSPLA